MRAGGILLPIASLPSRYGIGSFSKSANEFVDCLKAAGQKYWQILPIGPTGYGDSPYQSFSTFAGNPYFIAPEALVAEGMLTQDDIDVYDFGNNPRYISYDKIYQSRFHLLRKAFSNCKNMNCFEFCDFIDRNSFWIRDYALFMAIKDSFKGLSFIHWPEDIKLRRKEAIDSYQYKLQQDYNFYMYIQFLFYKQWTELKQYANKQGVKIIGDLPIYVAFDSADTWSYKELFQLDESLNPLAVAGCPPDSYSEEGQLWGNPLYRWEEHRKTGFNWWIKRISYSLQLYDTVRIDHFKGFDEYYSIPYIDASAAHGHWEKGPGYDFFQQVKQKLGRVDIIAEDLGYITKSVRRLLKKTGYPGMKVLEFAFDSREDNDYLPHNYEKNCVVYTGTHDNDTIRGWLRAIDKKDLSFALRYLNKSKRNKNELNWDFIRLAMQSVAELCIIPIQDYLGLDSDTRINIPATLGNNWRWRLIDGEFNRELIERIRNLTKLYGR